MIAEAGQRSTVHLVRSPSLAPGTSDRGRLTPAFACARAIELGLTPNAPVILLGSSGAERHAHSLGLRVHQRISLPLGVPRMGRSAMRRIAGGVDRLICWSDEDAGAAVGITDCVELVSTEPDRLAVPSRRLSGVTCLNARNAALWAERGVTASVIDLAANNHANIARRDAMRGQLGVPEDHLLFAALADRPRATDARGLVFALTVLCAGRFPVQSIVPAAALNLPAARRHHRATGSLHRMLTTERPPADWLGAVDFLVLPERREHGADTLMETMCRSQGCAVLRMTRAGTLTTDTGNSASDSLLDLLDAAVAQRREESRHD
ncbi:MAG: hypothetical protein AAGA55_10125 [Planctomycetota bacterium]